ncbi:hypothetical protein ACTXT7_006600 [Hymenolepis weldensis]
MDKNPGKSMRDILPKIFKYLKEQQYIRNVVHQDGPRLNTDADAYVETHQTIFVKPWKGTKANGGRPYGFQQESAPSHKPLKTQDWMDGRKFSSSCHAKLMTTS